MSRTSSTLAPPEPAAASDRRPDVDLLAPSIWSDRARLLARPDVVAVELLVLCAVAIMLRQPLSEVLGTAGQEVPVAPAAPAPAPAPTSPLALVPVAPPSAARHEPRDPFAPLVDTTVPAEGAPPAPESGTSPVTVAEPAPAAPAPAPVATAPAAPETTPAAPLPAAPAVQPTDTVVVQPGETLWRIAARHGVTTAALYAANKSTIGPDPDLIRPGLVLVLSAPKA